MTRSSLTRPVPLTDHSRPIFKQNENKEKTLRLYCCLVFIVWTLAENRKQSSNKD